MVRRARRPWSGAHGRDSGDRGPGQLLELPVQGGDVGLDGHHVLGVPAEDGLRGVMLRVHCVDREDRPGQVGERLQQLPHRGDLIGFLVRGDLAEDRADPVREGRDQVRGLPGLVFRAADGLAVDRDDQPAAGLHGPGPEPGTEDPVENVAADQRERGRNVDSSACLCARAQHRQGLRACIGGPLPDRGERPRPRDHRRDPHRQQPGQRNAVLARVTRVRNLGKEIKKVVAAGSRDRRRWHRRPGPSKAGDVSVRTSIVPPGPACRPQTHRTHHPLL